MNSFTYQDDDPADRFTPSDEVLLEYLLGSLNRDQVPALEAWLASDEQAGERIADLSEVLLGLSMAIDSSEKSMTAHDTDSIPLTRSPKLRDRSSRQRIGLALVIAAAIGFIAFSLAGFNQQDLDSQVAMAWADALPTNETTDTEPSDGLSDEREEFSGSTFGLGNLSDLAPLDDELADDMDLLSDEPPDWLLTAVIEMHDSSVLNQGLETSR